jgi:glutathione S-transferase
MNKQKISLYQPRRAFGLPCPSAFCVKLETYLRMADIPYQLVVGDPRQAPKGKVPWIKDGDKVIGDSTLIIDYLKQTYGDTVDLHLSAEEKALGHAIKRMLEEGLYFISSYSRWVEDKGFKLYSAELFADMPALLKVVIPNMVRKKVMKALYAQGTARHSPQELYGLGARDVQSFSALLGDKDFLFGDRPSSYDACAFGVIGNMVTAPFESPAKEAALATANISSYIQRIRQQYFPEL